MKTSPEQETSTDQPRTIRDSEDGELKTTIPNPHELPADVQSKKEEVEDGKVG